MTRKTPKSLIIFSIIFSLLPPKPFSMTYGISFSYLSSFSTLWLSFCAFFLSLTVFKAIPASKSPCLSMDKKLWNLSSFLLILLHPTTDLILLSIFLCLSFLYFIILLSQFPFVFQPRFDPWQYKALEPSGTRDLIGTYYFIMGHIYQEFSQFIKWFVCLDHPNSAACHLDCDRERSAGGSTLISIFLCAERPKI